MKGYITTKAHPPMLVPPMRSKTSHGFGGCEELKLLMSYLSISNDHNSRKPPLSRKCYSQPSRGRGPAVSRTYQETRDRAAELALSKSR
jgi:hypothetical protein